MASASDIIMKIRICLQNTLCWRLLGWSSDTFRILSGRPKQCGTYLLKFIWACLILLCAELSMQPVGYTGYGEVFYQIHSTNWHLYYSALVMGNVQC